MVRNSIQFSWLHLITMIIGLLTAYAKSSNDVRQEYIVYLGDVQKGHMSTASVHLDLLQSVLPSHIVSTSLLYRYERSFSGFVVLLTNEEKERISGMDGVVSVFPNTELKLQTTGSWNFMGLSEETIRSVKGGDIVVGVIDTGIWPESPSFNPARFGPPPRKWKGVCQNITCNNKIIGAREYNIGGTVGQEEYIRSPLDTEGHGTHVASIAAGNLVSNVNLLGYAKGTARGGLPSSRVAVYKVCDVFGCSAAKLLAAFDDAIADRVDVISISIASIEPTNYFEDATAIGSFHAMKKGILTSQSAGNDGPRLGSVVSLAPWLLSVAASTIDRRFITKVKLGNGKVYEGASLNAFDLKKVMYPIVYGGAVPNTTGGYTRKKSRMCEPYSIDANLVKGRIVLCDRLHNGDSTLLAGAVGTIMRSPGCSYDRPSIFPLAAACIGVHDAADVFGYVNSTKNPSATILKTKQVRNTLAPYVIDFSSRGPNTITPDILKPDVTAPGVAVLAAWPPNVPTSSSDLDKRKFSYYMLSGTSMACPHATGAAAYVKTFHPTWSPARIKSALMTTATPLDVKMSPDRELAYGAGHINPVNAVDPGLIFDIEEAEYVYFLCAQHYNKTSVGVVTGDKSACPAKLKRKEAIQNLNLPSLALSVEPLQKFRQSIRRTVTNVGAPNSTYYASISSASPAIDVKVKPNVLPFSRIGQKLSFVVTVSGIMGRRMVSSSLVWEDGSHLVRCPVVVYPPTHQGKSV